jgi:glycoprotein endo-alpha-1,2-mannosidase
VSRLALFSLLSICTSLLFEVALADDVNYNTHIFYYGWYGNPETDGHWAHWNHNVILREGGGEDYVPPESIGANFYPADGLYSSCSRNDIARQMEQIKRAGIGVLAATWWGVDHNTNQSLAVLFDVAAEYGLKVCFHIEPFPGRNAASTREAIVYLLDRYGDHPALYRCAQSDNRPMIYLYDSYLTPAQEWATVFKPDGDQTIRGTKYDVAAIGLLVKEKEKASLLQGGFDGIYTYFATEGFTFGSTPENWPGISFWAAKHNLLFIPSVGPGYIDTRIRPWNNKNTRGREDGAYYDRMFQAAVDAKPALISITSFNEWHEGTQIEPAVPKEIPGFRYEDYGGRTPDYYLERTRYWIQRWKEKEQELCVRLWQCSSWDTP